MNGRYPAAVDPVRQFLQTIKISCQIRIQPLFSFSDQNAKAVPIFTSLLDATHHIAASFHIIFSNLLTCRLHSNNSPKSIIPYSKCRILAKRVFTTEFFPYFFISRMATMPFAIVKIFDRNYYSFSYSFCLLLNP